MAKAKPKTKTIYVRVTARVHDELKQVARDRGYPHTLNSVAREALERGAPLVKPPSE